ncbi:MAG: DUF805 domain-containing protein [bacterium]
MHYYIDVLKKYAVFSGRSRRSEFWFFALFSFIASLLLSIISNIAGDTNGILGLIYSLVVLIPSIAVAVRRLHDTGRTGWWLLLAIIPIIGWIWLFVLYVLDSNSGDNKYGSNPKMTASAAPSTQV